ncbi:cobalamin biosynthesis protein CbiX [Mycolicibacillus trivialis]|uniref:Cobalamin biosynthesis protein CbiX n=1 Tax=Mycolicibacillus trivialis TaxID=1798 RepID=A0A1X2EFR1_9MYCO|nr:sirohydrochlorin chelatase [Mycolicibacillus trivialis]ORX00201.1 cobalamin biosynthesis protein CbiX [Mycolicibacillus trivialis]
MNRVLVAHGCRHASGLAMIEHLADRVGARLGDPVQVAFVDVAAPSPAELLSRLGPGPAVVVPAFLARGYHVRTDLPAQIVASGHPEVTVTPALGPGPALVSMLVDQLADAGAPDGGPVVLAAAGSSDPVARADLDRTSALLAARLGRPVRLAFAAAGAPTVAQAVRVARAAVPGAAVTVLSYLLADGFFQDRLHASGADLVTSPLAHRPQLAEAIVGLFRGAALPAAA